jgi:atrial natriuretic peptide receptor A
MGIVSILGYRHYRLEAEINSMSWKIYWTDVLLCSTNNRSRGSLSSFGRRGSQLVILKLIKYKKKVIYL